MKTKKEELQAELTRLNALRKQVKKKLKALPTYELNKWYKHHNGSLYFINNECENGHLYGYGFDNDGDWSVRNNDNYRFCAFNSVAKKEITLASREQVEQSLIEEAKSRYKVGDVIKCFDSVESEVKGTAFVFYNNCLFSNGESFGNSGWLNTYGLIFNDGQWATIIEQDKFAELKEAHRNGAVIEFRSKYTNFEWEVTLDPAWGDFSEYRIKPEEKPKVGDVCKFYYNDERNFIIGFLEKIVDAEFPYVSTTQARYQNAKSLTQQEAIDLLFNKGAN